MITWSLMLASGSAQDDTFASFEDLWSDPTLMGFSDYPSETDFYSQLSSAQGIISLASPIADLNQDNATDLLLLNISSDPETNAFRSEISILSGRDGSVLWARDYPDSLAFAFPVEDLNGDGRRDIIVDTVLAGTKFVPCSSIAALDGGNGTEIWSKSHIFCCRLCLPRQKRHQRQCL